MDQELIRNYFQSDALNISLLRLIFNPRSFKKKIDRRDTEEEEKRHFRIGGALDILLTQGIGVFNQYYMVAPKERPSGMMGTFIDKLPLDVDDTSPEEAYQEAYEIAGYKLPIKTVIENLWKNEVYKSYFDSRKQAQEKIVITHDEYEEMIYAQKELLGNPFTREFFINNDPNIEIIYQIPIYSIVTPIRTKSLLDGVIINHTKKTITPFDLKTTGKPINQFSHAFLRYSYYLQASWYKKALVNLVDFRNWKRIGDIIIPEHTYIGDKLHPLNGKFSELSDYRIENFKFIVAEVKPLYQNPPQIFEVTLEQDIKGWAGGMNDGKYYEGINDLIAKYHWHTSHNYWDMPMDLYLNQGITYLEPLS